MTESSSVYMQQKRLFHLNWLSKIILKPKLVFNQLIHHTNSWFTPMLILSIAILLHSLANGWVNQQAALSGEILTPPDFQYWSPEQQEQFFQSQQVRQGPVFLYIIPTIWNITLTWIGWLLVSGILHLALTMIGGRGETNVSAAIVAWASVPFILRSVIRAIYTFTSRQLIDAPGLSGFIDSASNSQIFLSNFLSLVDIYLLWYITLMILGVKICTGISTGKSITSVITIIGLTLLFQTLIGYFSYQISSITIIRPFFF